MSRNLDPAMSAQFTAPVVAAVPLVMLTFRTAVKYAWGGVGDLAYGGNIYAGVGSLGKIGAVSEGVGVEAQGTSVTLSGIDPALLGESLTDIKSGGLAKIWLALLKPDGTIYGTPYLAFRGTIDTPSVEVGADTISITLNLENRLVDLGRATQARYTAADQHLLYPDDIGFNWVESLNDIALRWGQ